MRKLIGLALCVVIIFSVLGISAVADGAPPGLGTPDSPFSLSTPAHLEWINGDVERLSKHYLVVADIVAPANFMIAPNFVNIWETTAFTGEFDGNGHAITVDINLPDSFFVGLFRRNNGVVRNLTVAGSVRGSSFVGGVVGFNSGGLIENISVTANVFGSGSQVGGITGENRGRITDSFSVGNVTGGSSVGGIVGLGMSGGNVSNSFSAGNVTGNRNVGGIVGNNNVDARIQNVYSTGNITGNEFVGGIAGHNSGMLLMNSFATGVVTANTGDAGGIVGVNPSSVGVENSVALNSNIISGSETRIGRIWGHEWGGGRSNRACADMLINGEPFTGEGALTNNNGQSVTADIAHTKEFWQDTMRWDFRGVWHWNPETRLPTLREVVGIFNIEVENNSANFDVSTFDRATVIIVFFEGDRFLNVIIKHQIESGRIENVAFPVNMGNANRIKIMLWNATETINPLSCYRVIVRVDGGWES